MTPMLLQYFRTKEENPDCILFFRVGDFFEAYGQDAEIFARESEITLTSKDAGSGNKIPMAGVPFFAVDQYLNSLVSKGYRVAICDQVEDPKKAKGLVKREVVRIVSSGTLFDPEVLDGLSNNFLAVIYRAENGVTFAFCDISTGEFKIVEQNGIDPAKIKDELAKWAPSELFVDLKLAEYDSLIEYLDAEKLSYRFADSFPTQQQAIESIKNEFNTEQFSSMEIAGSAAAIIVAAFLIDYIHLTQKQNHFTLKQPVFHVNSDYAVIDSVSRKNLELLATVSTGERKGSLLWAMDETLTPMGARLLKNIVLTPLLSKKAIEERLDSVEELVDNWSMLSELRTALKSIRDLERLFAKVTFSSANARDLKAISASLSMIPQLKKPLSEAKSPLLKRLSSMELLTEVVELIESSIVEEPPATLRDGGIISDSYSPELKALRSISRNGKNYIAEMEISERESTGIKSLKIGFNQVFGYYIEVTKQNLKLVPETYIRKQTIANGERFITEQLKKYESEVLGAQERIKGLEFELFNSILKELMRYGNRVRNAASSIAMLDLLASFATTASSYGYTRPEIFEDHTFEIHAGAHPVAQRTVSDIFVNNDLILPSDSRVAIVTGPNMSGKSTFLRQNALIAIMAQMGSFVPASSAKIGVIDKFFTRVGATDDLHLGQSTFMVEMLETANILNNATSNSLVILDEIGRGTSTYDGMSIAQAVIERLNSIGAATLFATHFHELTNLEKNHKGIINLRVAVKENAGEVIFLHKILHGASDKSYGIYVAELAGFPDSVLKRAEEILSELETRTTKVESRSEEPKQALQLSLFANSEEHPFIEELKNLNVMDMTPMQAINKIFEWQKNINGSKSKTRKKRY